MNGHPSPRKTQKTIVLNTLTLFSLTLLIVQLWLFVGALEGLISGRSQMAVPAAIVSVILMLVNVWMLVGVLRMERQP